jgi:signal transduction histidine kinase
MSHELRNPLNSIIGYSEILLDGLDATKDQKCKDLKSIRGAGHRLLELINDLLDLSKLEAGRMELHSDRVEIRDLIEGIAAKWHAAVVDDGSELHVQVSAFGSILCDSAKLQRVIENLLSNAAKFTKNGRIDFTASMQDGVLLISVEDNGAGIAENRIEGLFETFRHSEEETASNYADDVRLGLPLAHRYCRLMGGELSVTSKLGSGSRFTIRLPVRAFGVEQIDAHADALREAA